MSDKQTERRRWTLARVARTMVGILAVSGVAALLVRDRSSLEVLRDTSLTICALVVVIMSVNTLMFAARVRLVLDHVGRLTIERVWWVRIFVNSFALNLSVPQSGAVYRAVELRSIYGMPVTTYLRSYYVLIWLAYILVLSTGAVVMYAQETAPAVGGWDIRSTLLATLGGVLLGPLLTRSLARRLNPKSSVLRRLAEEVADSVTAAIDAVRDGGFARRFATLSAATIATDLAIVVLTAHALGLEIDLAWSVVLYVTLQLFNLLHVTPGNLGVQELVFGVLTRQAGLGVGDGLVLSMLLRLLRTASLALLFLGANVAGMSRSRRSDDPRE